MSKITSISMGEQLYAVVQRLSERCRYAYASEVMRTALRSLAQHEAYDQAVGKTSCSAEQGGQTAGCRDTGKSSKTPLNMISSCRSHYRVNLLGLSAAALLLTGCSAAHTLSSAGERVTFSDQQPGSSCQLLGNVTGRQSNWFSGAGGEGSSLRGAANDLRNRAAEMGGNVIYGAISPTQNIWSSFAPLDSKMSGQVYKCR